MTVQYEEDDLDIINSKIRKSELYSPRLNKFWFDWDAQRRYQFYIATELFLNNGGEDMDVCMKKASDFTSRFYNTIIKKR